MTGGYRRYDVENPGVDDYFVDPKYWLGAQAEPYTRAPARAPHTCLSPLVHLGLAKRRCSIRRQPEEEAVARAPTRHVRLLSDHSSDSAGTKGEVAFVLNIHASCWHAALYSIIVYCLSCYSCVCCRARRVSLLLAVELAATDTASMLASAASSVPPTPSSRGGSSPSFRRDPPSPQLD
jgi:hypothetical protein